MKIDMIATISLEDFIKLCESSMKLLAHNRTKEEEYLSKFMGFNGTLISGTITISSVNKEFSLVLETLAHTQGR